MYDSLLGVCMRLRISVYIWQSDCDWYIVKDLLSLYIW